MQRDADVAELVDAPDLGSDAVRRASSSLAVRTNKNQLVKSIVVPCDSLLLSRF